MEGEEKERLVHCKKMVKMTTIVVSGFIEQVSSMAKAIPKHNYRPSTPSQFDLASERHLSAKQSVSVHRQLSSSEPDNNQQMDGCKLVFIG